MCESLNLRAEALAAASRPEPVSAGEAILLAKRVLEGWQMDVPELNIQGKRFGQCVIFRDILDLLPFRPVAINPAWLAWNHRTVQKIAQRIYDERAFDRMPILGDALEEAGCTNADILSHIRGQGRTSKAVGQSI